MSAPPDKIDNGNANNAQITQEDFTKKVSRGLTTFTSGTLLVVIGFAVGALIILFDYFPLRPEDSSFIQTSSFQLFLLATIAQTVFWAVAFGSMWPSLRTLTEYGKGHVPELITWSLLFATLIYSSRFFAVSCKYSLHHHGLKTGLLTVLGGVVAIMAALGTILVNIGLREVLANSSHSMGNSHDVTIESKQADLVKEYLYLRGRLLLFLSILGMMLGLVTLAQSAKRYLIIKSPITTCDETVFTVGKVIVFGLYYTLILALTFLPTFSLLITTGHKLRDDIIPIPSPHNDAWESACSKRRKLEKLLALSVTESLRALIAILAPVIGSLASLVEWANKRM